MKYARLSSENTVDEVFVPPQNFPIFDCFHPSVVAQFVEVPDNVEICWVRQPDGFFAPPPPADEVLANTPQ